MNKLKPNQWSKKFKCCKSCGTTKTPHKIKGMCNRCEAKEYHIKNKEIINLKHKIAYRLKVGLPCLQIIIKDKIKYFPFKGIPNKPTIYNEKKYNIYNKAKNEFEILKAYYERVTKRS